MVQTLSVFYLKLMAEFFLQADPVHMRDMKHLLLDLAHQEVPEVGVGGREEKKRSATDKYLTIGNGGSHFNSWAVSSYEIWKMSIRHYFTDWEESCV